MDFPEPPAGGDATRLRLLRFCWTVLQITRRSQKSVTWRPWKDGIGSNDWGWRCPQLRSPYWNLLEEWLVVQCYKHNTCFWHVNIRSCNGGSGIPVYGRLEVSSIHEFLKGSCKRDCNLRLISQTKEEYSTLNKPQLCRIRSAESRHFWSSWSLPHSSTRPNWSFSRESHLIAQILGHN